MAITNPKIRFKKSDGSDYQDYGNIEFNKMSIRGVKSKFPASYGKETGRFRSRSCCTDERIIRSQSQAV